MAACIISLLREFRRPITENRDALLAPGERHILRLRVSRCPDPLERSGKDHFSQTHWSLVLQAGEAVTPEASEALERLCRTYWPPIYSFLRRKGFGPEDAKDLTQGFFARLLERNDFAAADPAKGRFRTYLLAALMHFVSSEQSRAQAQKRGGGQVVVPLESTDAEGQYLAEPATASTAERSFDQRWASTLLEQALTRLRGEFSASGKLDHYDALKVYLTQEAGPGGYEAIADRLGMKPGTVAVSVHRLRQQYRELLRAEVALTVADPREVDAEIRALFFTNE